MEFKLTINCDNAAFHEDDDTDTIGPEALYAELGRILQYVRDCVQDGDLDGNVRDTNGNTVGKFELIGEIELTSGECATCGVHLVPEDFTSDAETIPTVDGTVYCPDHSPESYPIESSEDD